MKQVACRGTGCCPEVELNQTTDGFQFIISDDHGGKIRLTVSEFLEVSKAANALLVKTLHLAREDANESLISVLSKNQRASQ